MTTMRVEDRTFSLDADNQLHSVRHDSPSRGPSDEQLAAGLVAGALGDYGQVIAKITALGAELVQEFEHLARLEKTLTERDCSPPRQSFVAPIRAALSQWRGEGFWERG